jgi:DDE family transposase
MKAHIVQTIERLQRSWRQAVEEAAVVQACREAGHHWRDRELNPITTIKMFLLQILYGNVSCDFTTDLAGKKVSGSSYCEARQRVPLAAYEALLSTCTQRLADCVRDTGRWLGHRLLVLDGCSFSMPDVPELAKRFGYPPGQAEGCGFPVAHWLAVVHSTTGLVLRAIVSRVCSADLPSVPEAHQELQPGDVVLGDTAFCSFAHFALLLARGAHGIFRMPKKFHVDFTPGRPGKTNERRRKKNQPTSRWIRSLGDEDQIVEWFSRHQPSWLSNEDWLALPQRMLMRELRYTIKRPGFRVRVVTLATTLLDADLYPKQKLAEAYGLRWQVETCFRHLKTTMHMDVLRCKTVEGVMKELLMFLLAYNLVRMTMLQAARQQRVPVERISFVAALHWLATARPDDVLRRLLVNPARPGRVEPRCRKRRPKGPYPWLQQPRPKLKQLLISQGVAA